MTNVFVHQESIFASHTSALPGNRLGGLALLMWMVAYTRKCLELMAVALLVASVKQAVERQPPQGRGGQKRVLTVKDQEERKLAKAAATVSLLPALPHLINKFVHLPDTVAPLLDLLQWLNIEMFTVGRQMKALDELLLMVNEVMKQTAVSAET